LANKSKINLFKKINMTIGQEILQELMLEAAVTRRFLENVPFEKASFKPHEKSETLGRLAIHVAEIYAWYKNVIESYRLDFVDFKPKDIQTNQELLTYFDELLNEAKQALGQVQDEELSKEWSMGHGETTYFTLPKKQVLRVFCMNHLIHHRSQLGVYLRLLDIAVPASYGPSADDYKMTLSKKYDAI
jgi:uncharacterized damage-inducible protein DinB